MEMILAILLYLGAIFCHCSYYQSEIDQITQEREPEIQMVQSNPDEMHIVETQFLPLVETITILDVDEQ